MADAEAAADAARRLAVRLTEHLARNARAGVVEPGTDEAGRPTVELHVPGGVGVDANGRSPEGYHWTVDPVHPETQYRDLCHRIDLLLVGRARAPEVRRTPTGPGWCEWE